MATHDYVIANGSGAAVRADINGVLSAIVSNNSSATEPTTTYAYQMWADIGSTPPVMKQRNSTNTAWITLFKLDGTSLPSSSATEIAFNDAGADLDFRIEGDNEANLFYVDAGNDRIGIGISSPNTPLHIEGAEGTAQLTIGNTALAASEGDFLAGIDFHIKDNNDATGAVCTSIRSIADQNHSLTAKGTALAFSTTPDDTTTLTERLRIDQAGNVGIGTANPDVNLTIKDVNAGGTGGALRLLNADTTTGSKASLFFTTTTNETYESARIDAERASTGTHLVFSSNAIERARIDNSGRFLVGPTSSLNSACVFQTHGDSIRDWAIKYTGTSGNAETGIKWLDKNNFVNAQISNSLQNDGLGAQAANLVFKTATGGTLTERMRIQQNGKTSVTVTESADVFLPTNSNGSFAATVVRPNAHRAASSAYSFVFCRSGNEADTEFNLRGDGNGYADLSWIGGGADYAEYFEWSDSNPNQEDRRGISVVLDGEKIREAVAGEDPIGVISGNPSVVGDGDIDRWKGKYLRDDFGTYILETYNVVSWKETISTEDGKQEVKEYSYEDWNIPADVVIPDDAVISATDENGKAFTHRKLNPEYDPDQEYVSREDRPEWDIVGLMGKLRIRKGQVTGSRWIKMRDISDSVEEWLVR